MSNRRVRCLSAASVLALSLAWTGPAQSLDQPASLRKENESIAGGGPLLSASDLFMSLTLQGYDLFSLGQFQAALEALLPTAAAQAGLAPAILERVRSLGFGEAHEAVASIVLKDALAAKPAGSAEPVQLAQAEQVICDEDAGVTGDCMMLIVPDVIPPGGIPALQNDSRGVENYSG